MILHFEISCCKFNPPDYGRGTVHSTRHCKESLVRLGSSCYFLPRYVLPLALSPPYNPLYISNLISSFSHPLYVTCFEFGFLNTVWLYTSDDRWQICISFKTKVFLQYLPIPKTFPKNTSSTVDSIPILCLPGYKLILSTTVSSTIWMYEKEGASQQIEHVTGSDGGSSVQISTFTKKNEGFFPVSLILCVVLTSCFWGLSKFW